MTDVPSVDDAPSPSDAPAAPKAPSPGTPSPGTPSPGTPSPGTPSPEAPALSDAARAVLDLLLAHERFVLTTHIGPDGDALGSEIALGAFLRKLGKTVTILNTDPAPYNLDWLPGLDMVEVFDRDVAQLKALAEADVAVVLDTNDEERLGDALGPSIRQGGATTVLIDHHTEPARWFDVAWVQEHAAATGLMIYDLIAAHDPGLIDATIATALYTAIMTDTGSFRYASVTPRLHRVIADLLERGAISPAPIHERIFDRRSMPGLRLLGRMLSRIRLRYDGRLAYSVVTQRMVEETGAGWDEKGGFVNYVLSIDGVQAALLFSEVNDGAKISFRSEGAVPVNVWARAFGGGGHRNASGAYVRRPTFEEAIQDVVEAAPKYLGWTDATHPEEPAHDTGNGHLSPEDEDYLQAMMRERKQ